MPGIHNSSSIQGGIFGTDAAAPSRNRGRRPQTPRSDAESVSNVLFGTNSSWSKAEAPKARLCPTVQAVAGVLKPKDMEADRSARPMSARNASSLEGGIFGTGSRVTPALCDRWLCADGDFSSVPRPSSSRGTKNVSSIPDGILSWTEPALRVPPTPPPVSVRAPYATRERADSPSHIPVAKWRQANESHTSDAASGKKPASPGRARADSPSHIPVAKWRQMAGDLRTFDEEAHRAQVYAVNQWKRQVFRHQDSERLLC